MYAISTNDQVIMLDSAIFKLNFYIIVTLFNAANYLIKMTGNTFNGTRQYFDKITASDFNVFTLSKAKSFTSFFMQNITFGVHIPSDLQLLVHIAYFLINTHSFNDVDCNTSNIQCLPSFSYIGKLFN